MDDVGRWLLGLGLSFLFVFVATLFSSADTAINEISEGRLKKLLDDEFEVKKTKALLKMKQYKFDFNIFSGSVIIFFIAAACVSVAVAFLKTVTTGLLYAYEGIFFGMESFTISEEGLEWVLILSAVILLAFSAFIFTLLGHFLPRKMALRDPEKTAFSLIGITSFFCVLLKPVSFITFKTARGILRLLKVDPNLQSGNVTEEEIRAMVDEGNESGAIETSEREMINNIFEFDDLEVADIMTHRTELAAVAKTDSIKSVVAVVLEEGFSRIPVYNEDIDDIVGILYAKDLLALLGTRAMPQKTAEDYMRPVIYVPDSTRCRVLFREFKDKKTHMAVVVDEYGGTAGIVTMEDLLESIVGNIQDEYDQEDEDINLIGENSYILQGGIAIEKAFELFKLDYDDEDGPDTLGGLIANKLGYILEDNETPTVEIDGVSFTVLKVEDRRIISVKATLIVQGKEEVPPESE